MRSSFIGLVLVVVAQGALAQAPAVAPPVAPTAAVPAVPVAPAKSLAPAAPVAPTDPVTAARPVPTAAHGKMICITEDVIGSRLGSKRVCRTQEAWDQTKHEMREGVERSQRMGAKYAP